MSLNAWLTVAATIVLGALAVHLSGTRRDENQSPEGFLLANRQLSTSSVANLLLSSSFGVNALFYNGWLGYQMGLWALLIQMTWAASFLLLARFGDRFRGIVSLHDFLRRSYGRNTQLLSAICSIIGITYFVGWELSIGQSAVEAMVLGFSETSQVGAELVAGWVTLGVVVLATTYTIRGGIRGNGEVNKVFNLLKIALVALIAIIGLLGVFRAGAVTSLLPTASIVISGFGLWGLATNVLFNLSWQFVDNSSWQSAISGAEGNGFGSNGPAVPEAEIRCTVARNLRISGLSVFLTIGVLGTLLGAVLRLREGVTDAEFFGALIQQMGMAAPVIAVGFAVIVIASMMSLVDGMLLSVALTVVADLVPKGRMAPGLRLVIAKWSLVVVALIAGWGIEVLVKGLGGNLFDFVYIVVVSQLALIGPVLTGLLRRGLQSKRPMWLAIAAGLVSGFGAITIGSLQGTNWLMDGAGTIAIITSLGVAWLIASGQASDPEIGRSQVSGEALGRASARRFGL